MSTSKGPIFIHLLFVSLFALLLAACGSSAPAGEDAFEPIDLSEGDTSNEPPPVEEESAQEDVDVIACPGPGSSLLLAFAADITINYESASITHTLHDGMLDLTVNDTNAIESLSSPAIIYEMSGVMDECSMEGSGEMHPSAYGYCQDGVVYLNITEDWGPYEGQLSCPDGVMPLNFPPLGVRIHQGADGLGEAFPLDANYSSEGAGYTSMRPFAGPGTGDHIWTLYIDLFQPVPLAP